MKRPNTLPLGIQQLLHHPLRLLSGASGLALVNLLLLAQLGFRDALLLDQEAAYFSHMANFSVLLTLLVGTVICYQVLALDARDHRQEYSMLRGLGYELRVLQILPLQQAVLLAALGFATGLGAALALLPNWALRSELTLILGPWQLVTGLLALLICCAPAAWLARRLYRAADPAEACR